MNQDTPTPTSSILPDAQMMDLAAELPILDRDGKAHRFSDIYQGSSVGQNVMFFLIRHFFCPGCQAYIAQVAKSIKPEELAGLPTSTSMILIGCGAPELIDFYAQVTGWLYPIYTDPTNKLQEALGCKRNIAQISTPGTYIQKSVPSMFLQSVGQLVSQVFKAYQFHYPGDGRVNGGEFFFQPIQNDEPDNAEGGKYPQKQITWCNIMKGGGDHAELPELREILGLSTPDRPEGVSSEAWAKVLTERKGTRRI